MKKSALSCKLALCTMLATTSMSPLFAQSAGDITFTWGDKYKLPKKHTDIGFIGNGTDGYLQVGHRPHRSLSLQHFDPQLHLTSEKLIDLDNMPDDYQNNGFRTIDNNNYWFFNTYEDKVEHLFVQKVDVRNGAFEGSAQEILHTSKLTGDLVATGFYQFATVNKWNFFSSFDRSKLLVEYRKKPEDRNDSRNKDIIGFQVFDKDMKKVWGREIRMPYTEEMMDNEDYQVDGQGNVYTLAKVYETNKKGDRKKIRYRFEILKWSKEKDDVTIIPFRFTDKAVNSAMITEGPGGQMAVVGYYSSYKNPSNSRMGYGSTFFSYQFSTDGVFVLKINPESDQLEDVFKGTYEFPASVLKEFESRRTRRRIEKKEDKGDAEAMDLVMRNVSIAADGSIQVYGEETFREIITYRNVKTGATYTTIKDHYNDVLAMNIGADGNMKWVKKIPKAQIGTHGLGEMSFKVFAHANDKYVFYMDSKRNEDLQIDEAPDTHVDGAGGVLMAAKIDQKGNLIRSKIFDTKEEKKHLIVTDFTTLSDKQMIVRGIGKKKKSQPALITFY